MHLVERALARPHHCALFPQLGANHPLGYIDTGSEMPGFDNKVYLSVAGIREVCNFLGWPTPESHADVVEQRDNLARALADVQTQLAEANGELDAIYVMRSRGWTPAKKPGRPKKTEEVNA